jgi:hypothetical protein
MLYLKSYKNPYLLPLWRDIDDEWNDSKPSMGAFYAGAARKLPCNS